MEESLVTVVTVCYNACKEIEKTMRSVLSQTYKNIEYIIIDGNSSDGTLDIINKVKCDYSSSNIVIVSEPDKGIYDAMNKAIILATGKWINFMNAGDCFVSRETLDLIFCKEPDSDVIFGNTLLCRSGVESLSKGRIKDDDFPDLGHQSTFVRTALMKKYHYNLKYKISADFDFLYRLYKEGCSFYYKDVDVAKFDMSGLSASHRLQLYKEHCEIRGIAPSFFQSMKYYIEDRLPVFVMNTLAELYH